MGLSAEGLKKRHDELDAYILEFRDTAHKLLNKINEIPYLQNGYILNEGSNIVLPATVMIIMSKFCKFKPTSKQMQWKAELDIIMQIMKKRK